MLLWQHQAISQNDQDFSLTNWVQHDIALKTGHEEPLCDPQRSVPYKKWEAMQALVDDLSEKGIIEECSSA